MTLQTDVGQLIGTLQYMSPEQCEADPHDIDTRSDVYAMGGSPIMAISVLGWPIDQLSAKVAADVISGSRQVCKEAGIQLAGGHSIDNPESKLMYFTGINHSRFKKTVIPGDQVYFEVKLAKFRLGTCKIQGVASVDGELVAEKGSPITYSLDNAFLNPLAEACAERYRREKADADAGCEHALCDD